VFCCPLWAILMLGQAGAGDGDRPWLGACRA